VRRLEFDAEEFPDPSAEERLVLLLEEKGKGRCADLQSFLTKSMGAEFVRRLAPGSLAFVNSFSGADEVVEHLRKFSGLPGTETQHASLAPLEIDWSERVIAVETSQWFVLYHWTTTA
jgi:hypothetical protein